MVGQLAIKAMLNGPMPDGYWSGVQKLFEEVDSYVTPHEGKVVVADEHGFTQPAALEAWLGRLGADDYDD